MRNFASREVCNLEIVDYRTGKPVLHVDYANTTATEVTAENVPAYGGWNRPSRVIFTGKKEGKFTIETQLRSFELYRLITGTEIENTATFIEREELTGDTNGVLTLSKTPIADTIFVFAADDDCGSALTVTLDGVDLKNPANSADLVVGSKYIVYYQARITENVQKININTRSFPRAVKIFGETLMKTEDDELLPYRLVVYKATPVPSITLEHSNDGDPATMTIEFDMSADKDGSMLDLIMITEEYNPDD